MRRDLDISKQVWELTPPPVRTLLFSLRHQLRLCEIRCSAYQQEVTILRQEVAQLNDLKAQIASFEHEIAHLRQQVIHVEDLKAEIAELRERLGRNSRNSSLPPSSDKPSQKQKSAHEPMGRKRGAQPGHPGHGRQLQPLNEVDHVIDLRPIRCSQCGHLLLGDDPAPSRWQVSEVPQVRAEVTEYRRHTLCCLVCGAENKADWSKEIPPGSFGPRAKAIVGYLSGRMGASHRDVAEAMDVLHGLEMGLGSISSIQRQVSAALAESVDAAQQFVQQQKAQYVDETGWPEAEQQKWLWVNATADVTVFRVLCGRSADDAQQVISQEAKGIVTTDRYSAYQWLELRRRQICWAHLKRDFQAFVERGCNSAETGKALLAQVKRLFQLWHKLRNGELNREGFQQAMQPVEQRVKKLLEAGSQAEHEKTRRTCVNILKVEPAL